MIGFHFGGSDLVLCVFLLPGRKYLMLVSQSFTYWNRNEAYLLRILAVVCVSALVLFKWNLEEKHNEGYADSGGAERI